MAIPTQFNVPVELPPISLAISQTDKDIVLSSTTDDFIAESKFIFCDGSNIVQTLTVGSGLVLTDSNRTLTMTLQGASFTNYVEKTLSAEGTVFIAGDRDMIFDLIIGASKL